MIKKQKENNDYLWKDGKSYFCLGSGWWGGENDSLHEPILSVCFNVQESFCDPQQGTPQDVLTAPLASLLVAVSLLSVLPLTFYASSAHTSSPSR